MNCICTHSRADHRRLVEADRSEYVACGAKECRCKNYVEAEPKSDRLSVEQAIHALERQLRLMRRRHNEEFDAVKAKLDSVKERHASQI